MKNNIIVCNNITINIIIFSNNIKMDNYYHGCPPMLSDGRIFADHRPATQREESIKYINNIVRDDEYRLFLQQNASTIMTNIWNEYSTNSSCFVNECVHNYPTRVGVNDFKVERENYNQLLRPKAERNNFHICQKNNDYRLSTN